MRLKIFAANWKMNKTIHETGKFLDDFSRILPKTSAKVWIAPPFTAISTAVHYAREKKLPVHIGAQNVSERENGAFTGEVSAAMLKEAGAFFCIVGHSERRRWYGETDAIVHDKIRAALSHGLRPLLCVGETKEGRDQGRVKEILRLQLGAALQGLTSADLDHIVIAYEPIWAIGTGTAATPDLAQEAHAICREFLTHQWNKESAQKIPLLYGGSVTPDNGAALLREPDIDGALVGGASLDPQLFAQLITSVPA